ncbi:g652 [Coccomyxa elongata]
MDVEYRLRDWLMNEGVFFAGVHEQNTGRDTELLVVASQEQYAEVVKLAQRFIEEITLENEKGSKCYFAVLEKEKEIGREQEKTQQEFAKAKQEKWRARGEEAKAAQLQSQVRLAELELQKHARPDAA